MVSVSPSEASWRLYSSACKRTANQRVVFPSRIDISIDEMTELVWGPGPEPPANTNTQQEAAASGGGGGSGGPSSSSSSLPSMLEGLSITERRRSVAMLRNGSYGGKERTEALSSTLIETSNKFYQDRLGTNTGNTFFTKPEEQSQNKTPLTNPLQEKTPSLTTVYLSVLLLAGGGQLGMFLASGKRKHRSAKDDRFFWIGNQQGKGKAVSPPQANQASN
jgi:hypothetical protein